MLQGIKSIQGLKSVQGLKEVTPLKSVQEITKMDEVVGLYELTDEQVSLSEDTSSYISFCLDCLTGREAEGDKPEEKRKKRQ